jgi:hypothetical protein
VSDETAPGGSSDPLAPLSLGDTIGTAASVYSRHAVKLWGAVALVVVPLEVIELIVRRVSLPAGTYVRDGAVYSTGLVASGTGVGTSLALGLIAFLAQLLSIGAVFRLVLDDYLGRPVSIGESFSFAAARLFALVWLSILAALLVAIGFLLFILPGIYLLVSFSVAVPVLMVEGRRGFAALARSRRLVGGRWWATFARLIVAWVLLALVSIVIGAINISAALHVSSITLYLAIGAATAAITAILTAPFTAAVTTAIYVDLRVRKDGITGDLLDLREPGWPAPQPE